MLKGRSTDILHISWEASSLVTRDTWRKTTCAHSSSISDANRHALELHSFHNPVEYLPHLKYVDTLVEFEHIVAEEQLFIINVLNQNTTETLGAVINYIMLLII